MSLVTLDGVGVAFGATTIFSGLDLRIEPRDRLAIVGANGAGKTSLLEVIAGTAPPSAGRVERDRRMRMAHLTQQSPPPSAPTVLAEVMASRQDVAALQSEMAALEQRLSGAEGGDLDAAMARYGEAQHAYEALGGYDLEARARAALGGLGLDGEAQRRHPRALSGGQVRRLEMAKLLLQDADLILLDEPTNHLDLAAIEWVEEFLRGVPAAIVVVSHDRRFIDGVCTGVLEIAHGVTEEYPGNYSAYARLRVERRARRRKEWEEQQGHITHQEEFIRRYRAGQRAREARGRQLKLDRLERVARPVEDERPRLRFSPSPGSNVLLRATDLVAGRQGRGIAVLERAVLGPGDRVAIVGANGSGKSTLLHTLAGELEPVAGTVARGARLRMRLHRQEEAQPDIEDTGRTVLDELLADHPIGEERGRTVLGSLLFNGDEVFSPVAILSGGERARLALGRLALDPTNLLLLDEPTNHLDIPAQEVLEEALQGYPGAVVLVSHDRALIDAIATRVWSVEAGDGGPAVVREELGGYSDLLRARRAPALAPARAAVPTPQRRAATPVPAGAGQGGSGRGEAPRERARERPDGERRERARGRARAAEARRLEDDIAGVEAELAEVRRRLADPATFADQATGAEAGREHDRLVGDLAGLYERWSELADPA
ncbi:MAG TPA: ABC-F family ATP-binding cassette domain-containing protein [Candidatus Dormibacteraeota bacterium]|nr:ABC-F family ATP-binding cassette domain-containing protein [Candidatus Dormibacteraeota bacterium]